MINVERIIGAEQIDARQTKPYLNGDYNKYKAIYNSV